MSLDGRVAVITGAAQGIGYAVARRLTSEGALCALIDVNSTGVHQAASQLTNGTAWSCDVTDCTQVQRTFEMIEANVGPVDILVNNAGIWRHTPVLDSSEADWDRIYAVNVKGLLFCSQAIAPSMQARRRGKIVTIASLAGLTGNSHWGAYAASKSAAISLTLSLADALRAHDVHVSAVCPGAVETSLTEKIRRDQPGATFDHAIAPSEVAELVCGLLSPFGQDTNGRILPMADPSTVLGIAVT